MVPMVFPAIHLAHGVFLKYVLRQMAATAFTGSIIHFHGFVVEIYFAADRHVLNTIFTAWAPNTRNSPSLACLRSRSYMISLFCRSFARCSPDQEVIYTES